MMALTNSSFALGDIRFISSEVIRPALEASTVAPKQSAMTTSAGKPAMLRNTLRFDDVRIPGTNGVI
jgi:hypothetical protein